MSLKWTRGDIEKLINCIQQYPCIYNVKSSDYVDRIKKAQAFNEILQQIQESLTNVTLDDIKRKWKNLRTQFMQEIRMINNSKKSGAGRTDLYVPKLWCYDQLSFLKTHTQIRSSIDNIEDSSQEETSVDLTNSPDIQDNSQNDEPPKKKTKGVEEIKNFRAELKNFKNVLGGRKNERKFAWLGTLVATQMDDIDPSDQPDSAWQVQCLMRRLTSDSARKRNTYDRPAAPVKDILELSMDGIFDNEDFD